MRVELEKLILDQDPDPDQSQNLKECSLSEGYTLLRNFMNNGPWPKVYPST